MAEYIRKDELIERFQNNGRELEKEQILYIIGTMQTHTLIDCENCWWKVRYDIMFDAAESAVSKALGLREHKSIDTCGDGLNT